MPEKKPDDEAFSLGDLLEPFKRKPRQTEEQAPAPAAAERPVKEVEAKPADDAARRKAVEDAIAAEKAAYEKQQAEQAEKDRKEAMARKEQELAEKQAELERKLAELERKQAELEQRAAAEAQAKAEAEAQAAAAAEAQARAEAEAQAAAAAEAQAAEAAAAPRTYVVRSGDNLSWISERFYGTQGRWRDIYEANRGVIGPNPSLIHPGQELVIPD